MKHINVATYLSAILLCLLLNLFSHQSASYAVLNSLLYAISLLFIYKVLDNHFLTTPLFIILTAFIPLFRFGPATTIIYIFPFAYIISWFIAGKISRYKYLFITLGLILLLWGALISNNILTFPKHFNPEHLIINDKVSLDIIKYHQKDARYVPYTARLIIFNKSVYLYTFFESIFNFLTFKNLYDTLLFANLYPLIIGLILAYKNRARPINIVVLLGAALTLIITGLNKTPDKFNSLFTAAPLLFYLIILGLAKVNKKLYSALFVISMILSISPV